ncbi:MAG: DUF4115 domain-containing protein [Endomicrobiales bacterium]|nr:DUF4115 domain-containing protein [Endomicrobiales bacterium]
MKQIGLFFKKTREEKEIDLETVHKETRISKQYLQAFEKDDMSQFPADVYYTGTIRKYANYLGLNAEEFIESFYNLQKIKNSKGGVLNSKEKKGGKNYRVSIYLALFIIVAGYGFMELMLFVDKIKEDRIPVQNTIVEAPKVESLKLVAEGVKSAWLKVEADNRLVFEGTLPKGNKTEWIADERFLLTIGYVPGLKVTLNGKEIDITKGAKGEVNKITLTRDDLGIDNGIREEHVK